MDSEKSEPFVTFSLKLALSMQIIGFSVRFLSSFLWIQMYRLGVASVDSTPYREADFDVRNSFLNPPIHGIVRENSTSDDILGGSIYDPAYYSSLFEDAHDKGCVYQVVFLLSCMYFFFSGQYLLCFFNLILEILLRCQTNLFIVNNLNSVVGCPTIF